MYDRELINDVLKAADIADVVRHYLPDSFQKKGKNYAARCPFHDDHDPSLSINVEKQIYHCFVCGHGGNSIRFVQEYTHCSFMEAVRKTAEIAGFHDPRLEKDVPLSTIDPQKKRLLDCIDTLQNYYRYALSTEEGAAARDYLAKRNLDEATQAKFGIGYAPLDGSATVRFLRAKGFSPKNIEEIGISNVSDSEMRDVNAGRITFPLWDNRGAVIGFSARQIIRDPQSGKYRNSPETPLFHKGDVLYNYHNVAESAHHDGYCYVLEGFMDVMALNKAGLPNAIALMGVALTKNQVSLLKRLRCEIRLCLDGDLAGQTGMMGAMEELSVANIPFQIVDYGNDLRDPDDILQEDGKDALVKRMQTLSDPIDFQLSYLLHFKKTNRPEEKKEIIERLGPSIMRESGIEKENHIAKLAKALQYEESALRIVLSQNNRPVVHSIEVPSASSRNGKNQAVRSLSKGTAKGTQRLDFAENTILYYLLTNGKARKDIQSRDNPFYSENYRQILFYLLQYASEVADDGFEIAGLLSFIEENEPSASSNPMSNIIASVADEAPTLPYSPSLLDRCSKVIAEEKQRLGQKKLIIKAVETGDSRLAASALKAFAEKRGEEWKKQIKEKD